MNIKDFFNKTIQFINPRAPIGGLDISDAFLRFFLPGQPPRTISVRLEPGVLVDGFPKNEDAFIEALKKLRAQISSDTIPESVVATVRSASIYTQYFSLPPLPKDKIPEAVDLNLSAISPVSEVESYRDAEFIGRGATNESEYLGAFAPRVGVDALVRCLRSGGFSAVALEFSGLSLARAIRKHSSIDINRPLILIRLSSNGLDFLIIKNGNLYFQYLSSWESLLSSDAGREIEMDSFLAFLAREAQRILNFYSAKWGGGIKNVVVASGAFPGEGRKILEELDLVVEDAALVDYRDLNSEWFLALGAASRGETARASDVFISLTPVGTEEEYSRNKNLRFIKFWRNALAAVFAFLLVIFLISDSYLYRVATGLARDLKFGVPSELIKEVEGLEKEAQVFNRVAGLASAAKAKEKSWSPIFSELKRIAGSRIILRRVYADASGGILVVGRAPSELLAITFKNSLSQSPLFKEANLPLAGISSESDGGVGFQLTVTLK